MKQKNVAELVKEIMLNEPDTRDNDNLLILLYLKAKGMPTDLETLAKSNKNYFESVSRARRKLQEMYPYLRSSKSVQQAREIEKCEYLDLARDYTL